MSATDTTPLLHGLHHQHARVPTFMQTSVPSRRQMLEAFAKMALHLLIEMAIPIAMYYLLRIYFEPLQALLLAGVVPVVMAIIQGVREHKADTLAILMIFSFLISGILATIQPDPKLYLLRESSMTLIMGVVLLFTLIPFRWNGHILRPFMFYVGLQIALDSTKMVTPATVREHWRWFWAHSITLRSFFRALTALWALGLISECVVRLCLVMSLDDVDEIVYDSNLYVLVVMVTLGTLTIVSALVYRHLYNREQTEIKQDASSSTMSSNTPDAAT